MRVVQVIVASCILAVSGASVAVAQSVNPLRVLEESRRDRLELDRRIAREAAAQRQKEKAAQAAQSNAQRKLEQERAAAANSAPTGVTPSPQLEASSTRETVPGAPIPAASSASAASGTPDSNRTAAPSVQEIPSGARLQTAPASSVANEAPALNQPVTPSARGETALPPRSAGDAASEMPPSNQLGAASVHEVVAGAPVPTAPASSATSEPPATNQPAAPLARDAVVDTPAPVPTRVLITVDKAAQRMRVTVDGKLRHSWAVSTGRAHYETPTGTFRPLYLAKVHYSKEWDDAPMPHSIFFTDRGHAIHASNATRSLGRRASHGCVRLAPSKAATLFALVRAEGVSATKVLITNGTSAGKAARSRTADGSARRRTHVRRAFSDPWQIGSGDRWAE
jgi:lipoprotein-anchoring transpeptidase ErfK/SrfK